VILVTFCKQTWFWLWTGWTANRSTRNETCFSCSTFRNHAFSYSTSGPVSTWMGDRLPAGKPSLYVASHLGW